MPARTNREARRSLLETLGGTAAACPTCGKPPAGDHRRSCFQRFRKSALDELFRNDGGVVRLEWEVISTTGRVRRRRFPRRIRIDLIREASHGDVLALARVATAWNDGLSRFIRSVEELDGYLESVGEFQERHTNLEALYKRYQVLKKRCPNEALKGLTCEINQEILKFARCVQPLDFVAKTYSFIPLELDSAPILRERLEEALTSIRRRQRPKLIFREIETKNALDGWTKRTSKRSRFFPERTAVRRKK
jgi:hypothetical protein